MTYAHVPNTAYSYKKDKKAAKAAEENFIPNPSKAVLLAIAPGAGQFYNRHYVKIPFLYAGLTFFILRIDKQRDFFHCFEKAHKNALFNGVIPDEIRCHRKKVSIRGFNVQGLQQRRDSFRKNMELAYIGASILYLFSILDAYVDAHLQSFDVSEDLSLRLSPYVKPEYNGSHLGFVASVRF